MSKFMQRFFCLMMIITVLLAAMPQAAQAAPAAHPQGGMSDTPGWTTQSNSPDANFGAAMAPAGDVNKDGYADFLVGAPGYDGAATDTGRAYLYYGSASGPRLGWFVDTSAATSKLGTNLAGIGDVNGDGYDDIAISAPFYEYGGETDEGAVYVWHGGADMDCGYATCSVSTTVNTADWYLNGQQSYAYLSHIAGGDVNNDGFSDLVVGIPYIDRYGVVDVGGVFVFHGSSSGLHGGTIPSEPLVATWKAYGTNANDRIGYHVAVLDVKSGGGADVFASAPYYSNGQSEEGAVFGWYSPLSGDGSTDNASWKVESNEAMARLGWRIASAGDVEKILKDDLIISAPFYGANDAGMVLLILAASDGSGLAGSGGQWKDARGMSSWQAAGGEDNANLGFSVGTAGDVNQDGFADVLFGSHAYGSPDRGGAFIYLGTDIGLECNGGCPSPVSQADWAAAGEQDGQNFGKASAGVGDVNGDGADDILVGAPLTITGATGGGKIYLYYGKSLRPVSVNDLYNDGYEGQIFTVAAPGVLANDSIPSGEGALTATLLAGPATGSVTVNADGSFSLDARGSDYSGYMTFTYQAHNGSFVSDPATVSVLLKPVNDPPSFTKGANLVVENTGLPITIRNWASNMRAGPDNETGQTMDFYFTEVENSQYILLPSLGAYSGHLSFVITGEGNGVATLHVVLKDSGGTGNGGSDTSPEETFTITITHNNPPVIVDDVVGTLKDTPVMITPLTNDSDADGDALQLEYVYKPVRGTSEKIGSQIKYTPPAGESGSDFLYYTIHDGRGHHDTGMINITIRETNTPPVAVDDQATLNHDERMDPATMPADVQTNSQLIAVTANDTDADGDRLVVTEVSQPAHGTAMIGDGTVTYQREGGFFGVDTFAYTITDGFASDTAQVTVMVMPGPYIILLPAIIRP